MSELRVVAFAQFAKKSEMTCDFVDIEFQKLISRSVTRWQMAITLSRLAKDASIILSFKFILHVHRQAKCCSETFFMEAL